MGNKKNKPKQKPEQEPEVLPFNVVIPGGKPKGFDSMLDTAAYVREYLTGLGPDAPYIVADAEGNILQFDPFDPIYYNREDAVLELETMRARYADGVNQISAYRELDRARKGQLISAGLIPVDVLKGHVQQMEYDNNGVQTWVIVLKSYGPAITDDSPLSQAIIALTDHLAPPDETIGNPDDAAAVITELPA